MSEDEPWVIRRDDARDRPRIDTISRVSEACSAAGSLSPTSAPMPTYISTGVDLHRRQCRTGSISSIYLYSVLLSSIYGVWWLGRVSASPQSIVRDF